MTECILIEELKATKGKIGVLQLNAPKTLNSLTLEMVEILSRQLNIWEEDEDLAMVVLKGSGDKAFCAGGDVQELYKSAIEQPGGPCEYGETFFLNEYVLDYQIHQYAKPILCLGHGIVMGGGLGLMAGASHRVASETSRIAMPEITIGLYPDVGGTYFLNNMPFNLGYFFGLTGAPINASDALFVKLADYCIPSKLLDSLNDALCSTEWQSAEENHEILNNILEQLALSGKELSQLVPSKIQPNLNDLEEVCLSPSLSEMLHSLDNLETDDKWLTKAKLTLASGSPLSSLIIYEQIKRHKGSDLREVFLSEYQLSTNVIRFPEFAEGVRALLIDKDNEPKWHFNHFSAVPTSLINKMFEAPWEQNPLEGKI